MKSHCARGQHREECACGRKGNCSPASAPPSPPLFFVTSCPLLLFALSPSVLFVQGTYQPEREKRREGGGVSQHVRQERGGKRERIACGGGTQKADCEVGRRLKENSCFFHLVPPIINCCSSNWVLRFCWVPVVRERKPTRERR